MFARFDAIVFILILSALSAEEEILSAWKKAFI
jgi:hypothetical protein